MLERTVKDISTVKIPSPAIRDAGTVRLGLFTPLFPPISSAPASVVDNGKVRVGLFTPLFPATPEK